MLILVLMINALIAQISHSYDEAQDQASQLATYAKARFLMAVYPVLPIFGRNRQHERFFRWTTGYRRTPCCCGIMVCMCVFLCVCVCVHTSYVGTQFVLYNIISSMIIIPVYIQQPHFYHTTLSFCVLYVFQ